MCNIWRRTIYKNIAIQNGEKTFTCCGQGSLLPIKEDELDRVKININLPEYLEAPINKGEKLGDITVYLDGQIIHKGSIIAKEEVDQLSVIKRLIRRIRNN